jgi:hypothetical protein
MFFVRSILWCLLGLASAGAEKSAVLSGTATPIGPAYSSEIIQAMLRSPTLPTGLRLYDKQQAFANIANEMNTNRYARQTSHTGYRVELYMPSAWLGMKRARATKEFKVFGVDDVEDADRLPIIRVHISPDTPIYLTAAGTASSHSVEHVVLRSIDRSVVVQPAFIESTETPVQNTFGARLLYTGATAAFSLADLEKVRSTSRDEEFLVTIIGQDTRRVRDFRVKRKNFQALGD